MVLPCSRLSQLLGDIAAGVEEGIACDYSVAGDPFVLFGCGFEVVGFDPGCSLDGVVAIEEDDYRFIEVPGAEGGKLALA